MLLKNVLNTTDAISEVNNENKESVYKNITVKSVYKIIWKFK